MPPTGTASAAPAELDAYVRATTAADLALDEAAAGLPTLLERWNASPSEVGGRLDAAKVVALEIAVDELAHLDLWVGQVADAFRAVDRFCPSASCGPVLVAADALLLGAGPAGLAAAVAEGRYDDLFEVVRSGTDGRTRVVRLAFDRPPDDMSPLEWRLAVEAVVGPGAGPLHLVVHGWGTTSPGAVRAGELTADLHDQQGVVGATVVVVDWDAGEGTRGDWWTLPWDFTEAEASARAAGDALAAVLSAVAATVGDRGVAITAHSLGNHVAARALSQLDEPPGEFAVDLLAVQPALPATAPLDDPEHYGALAGPRVRSLTLTVDAGDDALGWYEVLGPEALGDERADGRAVRALRERRDAAGLATEVVDHDSAAGGGHLGLAPSAAQPLVRTLTQELVDRMATGAPSPQSEVRRWLYEARPRDAEALLRSPELRSYLDRQQERGEPPSPAEVERIAEAVLPSSMPATIGQPVGAR